MPQPRETAARSEWEAHERLGGEAAREGDEGEGLGFAGNLEISPGVGGGHERRRGGYRRDRRAREDETRERQSKLEERAGKTANIAQTSC